MPANETSVPRLRPRSRSFRVFPGGTGVSPPASDRMRSELFTLINLSNWPVSEFGEKAGTFLLSGRASGRLQEIFGKCVELCGSLAVLHGSFCDRARRGREFQERNARFVKFTVVPASEEDVSRL